jgi:two-component system sensor histidine kinase DctS
VLRDILIDICAGGERAADVIGRIREFILKREPRVEAFDFNLAATSAVKLIALEARRRDIRIDTEFAYRLPPVFGDRMQVEQVIINLVINGMDAMANTPEPLRHLTIRTKAHDIHSVEASIIDRGTGIPPDVLTRIFDSFFTTKPEGTGLGLSISQSIVVAHHGCIWAENRAGGGAAFHFTLPTAHRQ